MELDSYFILKQNVSCRNIQDFHRSASSEFFYKVIQLRQNSDKQMYPNNFSTTVTQEQLLVAEVHFYSEATEKKKSLT